jgi:glycosyltransferase involved in cell wall biosynthesis
MNILNNQKMLFDNVTICTFEYGYGLGPEGICTKRLVKSLADSGIKVEVLTTKYTKDNNDSNINISKISAFPYKLVYLLNRIFKIRLDPEKYWRIRAEKVIVNIDTKLIYARANPVSSIYVAYKLSIKYNLPLAVHFSDPIPNYWADPKTKNYQYCLATLREIVASAQAITFTTSEALEYQEAILGYPIKHKSFVLNHVAPSKTECNIVRSTTKEVFLYIGTLYGNRSPSILLKAFALYHNANPNSELHFVGSSSLTLHREINKLRLHSSCVVHAKTPNLLNHYSNSTVLVAMDANDDKSVFISTKLIEYLMVDRPILLITPNNSPSYQLLQKFKETTLCAGYDAKAIADGMQELSERHYSANNYNLRFEGMKTFEGNSVASLFIDKISNILFGAN